jgi:peptidoglycan/LPS O-acetylase OafA/YrhL
VPNKSSRIHTFDDARGLAALAVCVEHLRVAVFVDYGQLETISIAIYL